MPSNSILEMHNHNRSNVVSGQTNNQAYHMDISGNPSTPSFNNNRSTEDSSRSKRKNIVPGRETRRVALNRAASGFGFNIIGGNQPEEGIFISFILTGGPADLSGSLFKGDQILSVNGINLAQGSHEKAVEALKRSGERVDLVVQYRPEEYRACETRKQEIEDLIQSSGVPTSGGNSSTQMFGSLRTTQKKTLYVRALFTYDPNKDGALPNKGLAFRHGDILHVINASDDEWWQARLVGANGEDEPGFGIIPSKRRVERRERARLKRVNFSGKDSSINASSTTAASSFNHTPSSSSTTSSGGGTISAPSADNTLERKKRGGLFKKLTGKSKDVAQEDNNEESGPVLLSNKPLLISNGAEAAAVSKVDDAMRSYEQVVQEDLRITRPIVIFGPLKEKINDELLKEFPTKFASCVPHTTRPRRDNEEDGVDYHFVSSREEMDHDLQSHKFIEAGQYNGHLYGTSVHAVRVVAESGRHCVLDVSGMALKRLQLAGLAPISIFIKLSSPEVLQSLSRRMTLEQAKKAFDRHCKLEAEFLPLFTAVVTGITFDQIYHEVQKVIVQNSGRTIWVTSKEPLT